ncbi:hypothetical protein [Streptomyces sp. GQFP]|uniref:hypothetical protein n=1 Tax=Streptomyces sp. GQFP TaxID=2907545 RepID=UPI001F275732|nr:hypothetical protein [Streptomyces sp. GQFP]UIX32079.1 hypothetical protein LUX31_19665 [Streptomyces sp. GQFP]
MVDPLVCLLVTVLTSAVLVEALDITGIGDAVIFGLLVDGGYLRAMTFQIAINPNFPRPLYYGILNAPFFVITSVLNSTVVPLTNTGSRAASRWPAPVDQDGVCHRCTGSQPPRPMRSLLAVHHSGR